MFDRLDAEFHELVCGFCQPSGELAAVTEENVVVGATKPGRQIRHRLDLRYLELNGDILFWHLLDGFFGGQHLPLLLTSLAVGFRFLTSLAVRFRLHQFYLVQFPHDDATRRVRANWPTRSLDLASHPNGLADEFV